MNSNTRSDLRKKDRNDLVKILGQCRKDLFNLRFKQANGNLKTGHLIRLNRRKVALIKTLMGERRAAQDTSMSGIDGK